MSNLYQFLEKTNKKNIFLEDKDILKEKLFLLDEDEINLFKRDKKTFENFYGENVSNLLSEKVKNKTNEQFFNLFEVRSGKLKYLIAKTEEQITKAKKEKNKILLESELKKLRKRERRLFSITNERIKNYYTFNEAEEKAEDKEESFLNRGLKKFENLTGDFIKKATEKINYKEDTKLSIAIKWGARIMSMLYAVSAIKGLIALAPFMKIAVITALCAFIIYLVAVNTPTALNFLDVVLDKNKEIISKTLGITIEEINNFRGNVKGLENKLNKIIEEYKAKAKKILIDGLLKKINLFFKNRPTIQLFITLPLYKLKLTSILKNPVTFLIQFFSGMLYKSCASLIDGLINVVNKYKGKKFGRDFISAVSTAYLGFEPQKTVDLHFKDENKDQQTGEKEKTEEIKTPENASFVYKLNNELQEYYNEYIQNNILSNSIFVKERSIFYEAEPNVKPTGSEKATVNKQMVSNIIPKFYKANVAEATIFSLRKGIYKASIYTLRNKIYFMVGTKLLREIDAIEENLKKMGITDEDYETLKITNNYIEFNEKNYEILKQLFDKYTPGQQEQQTQETEPEETEAGKEAVDKETDKAGENTPEKTENEQTKAVELLANNDKLYIPLSTNSSAENLEIVKEQPSKENNDLLGYIELNKKEINKNNYRYSGLIYIKKVFDYSTNKLISLLFEEEKPAIQDFINITKEPALISIRVENGKYIINSGKFLGMFGEKSKKGKVNETFFDYIRYGIKKLKSDYMSKYDLEIKKLDQTQKNELEQKINDILFNFDKTDNFSIKGDALRERKKQDLEKIAFDALQKTTKEKKEGEEEKPKEDKNKILAEKEIYVNIPDEKTQIDIADLPLTIEKPKDGIGYIKLTKKDNGFFDAKFFAKKAFNYKKNNFLKTIFEQEQEENLPESEIEKIDYIDVTGEPAEVEIKLIDNKFAVSQKGGFLGFNKKINKIGKVNNNYKEYINTIIPQIEREVAKNKIDKNSQDVQDKIKDISTIDFNDDIKKAKEDKISEIINKISEDSIEQAEKEAKKDNIPFISNRNAGSLALFSFVSCLAIYWHASGKSVTPDTAAIIDILNGIVNATEDTEINISKVAENFNPEAQVSEIADTIAPETQNLPTSDNPDDFKEIIENPALKNTEAAIGGVSQETIDNADAGNTQSIEGGDQTDVQGDESTKSGLNNNKKEIFDKLYSKNFNEIVNKDDVFKKIKESWIASHRNIGIKIEDIKPGSELYKKLDNFTDKVIGSVNSIKDQPDGFYTKTPSLVDAINKDPDNAINAIKNKLDFSIEKGWTANQIAKIELTKEIIPEAPEPALIVEEPPKEPLNVADEIPKTNEVQAPNAQEPPESTPVKAPDVGDETTKPSQTEAPKTDAIVSDQQNLIDASAAFKDLKGTDLEFVTSNLKIIANGNIKNISDNSIKEISRLLDVSENFIKNLNPDHAKSILNAIPKVQTGDSYVYINKNEDEKFLLNEYFKMEERLNRWKK